MKYILNDSYSEYLDNCKFYDYTKKLKSQVIDRELVCVRCRNDI